MDEVEVETTGKNCLVYNLQSKKFYVCNMIQFANVNTVTVSLGFIVRNTVDKKLWPAPAPSVSARITTESYFPYQLCLLVTYIRF